MNGDCLSRTGLSRLWIKLKTAVKFKMGSGNGLTTSILCVRLDMQWSMTESLMSSGISEWWMGDLSDACCNRTVNTWNETCLINVNDVCAVSYSYCLDWCLESRKLKKAIFLIRVKNWKKVNVFHLVLQCLGTVRSVAGLHLACIKWACVTK